MSSRSAVRSAICCLSLCGVILVATDAAAQQRRNAAPSPRPTISPYFGLFRSNTGGIPNYHAFLRRDENYLRTSQQFRQFVDQSNTGGRAGRSSFLSRGQQLQLRNDEEAGGPPRFRLRPTFRRPASPATFQFYSHYYRTQNTTPARAQR